MGLFSPVVWTYLFNHDYLSHKLTNLHSTCCDPKNFSYCIDRSVLLRTKIRRIDMTKFRNGMGHFSLVILREAKSQFPPFQTYAPINVNPVGGGGVRARGGDLMPQTIPLSGSWSYEATPGSGHLTLTDRSLVSIQKRLPSPSLEAFWKSRCWRKV